MSRETSTRPNYFDRYKKFLNKEMMMMVIPIILIIMILFSFLHLAWKSNHETQSVTAQLNTVQRALNQLSYHNQNPAEFKDTLSNISNNMSALQKSVDHSAKTSDVDKITAQITVITQSVGELKKLVAESGNGKEYLDVKNLPFKVISVDVISEQPFVSIDYQNHITPMGIGDTVAGWEIVSADYDNAAAEFKNNKDQYVKVNLEE